MSSFEEMFLRMGEPDAKPATDGDWDKAWDLAMKASSVAYAAMVGVIEQEMPGLGNAQRKAMLLMIAVFMQQERMREAMIMLAKAMGPDAAKPVLEVWAHIKTVFDMTPEEREQEMRDRGHG